MVDQQVEITTPESLQAMMDALLKPFPREALKTREGAKKQKFTYVDGMTVVRRLTRATGNSWSCHVTSTNLVPNGMAAATDYNPARPKYILYAVVELTIPGLGTRTHMGVQAFTEGGGEDMLKGAITDGIKKAATLFGVADNLYGEDIEHQLEEADARENRLKDFLDRVEVTATEQGIEAARVLMAEAKVEWMSDLDIRQGTKFFKALMAKYEQKAQG
jgi:hypothetical protein